MRSRYSAYVLHLADYLSATWHSSTRPPELSFDDSEPRWCGLEILSTRQGGEDGERGEVEFVAQWLAPEGRSGGLHERSRFVREAGCWYYVDGDILPTVVHKVGRNEPCPCGSGKKFKQCCGK